MALILSGDTGVPASGMPTGSVIQVKSQTFSGTQLNTFSDVLVTTGLSLSITPQFSTSKIFITMDISIIIINSTGGGGGGYAIARGATVIWSPAVAATSGYYGAGQYGTINANPRTRTGLQYLDSPATTSPITYSLYYAGRSSNGAYVNPTDDGNNGATVITLMEIKA